MLNIYTVSFFGHREIRDMNEVEDALMPILHELITTKEYVEFIVGRDGDFDQIVSSAIRTSVKKRLWEYITYSCSSIRES